ncbi:hypothetical protein PFLmoz3_02295 [Pseudomonas fluorescens]|uniref:Uncharacterized protein n=1 Tax=Pseudomonas fluorescens TaxID=294 RepID=A0A120G7X3_PSEFL|nr:hypothetical protein PFLmoz3_02295 [Pseudomonas fluorescens]
MQVVRAGPDVQGDQRPEVHDRQTIGIHRALGLFGHEVVHHAEEARSQEKAYRVVPIPPLHHGIGRTAVQRVGLGQADRDFQVIDDMQNGHGDDERAEEPVTHIDVLGLAFHDRAEEHDGVGDPDDGDQDVDRPFQLGVFLGAGVAQWQADGGQQDHKLPAPEAERGDFRREQLRLAGALHRVKGAGEQRTATEREDHRIGVQWAQTAEAGPGQIEVERRPNQLGREKNPEPHADDAPHHRHNGELADHLVVIGGT